MKPIKDWPREFPGQYWLDREEDKAVLDVLRHGSLFRYYGRWKPKYVDAFEEAARKFYGVKYALALNSGTGALTTAMAALGIGPGCEVLLPAYMWVASAGSTILAGAIPVLCEVDDSLTLDPQDLERKITPRTRLIVPIHMSGAPCNMAAILEIAERRQIPVLEDAAQCNGGSFHGRKAGSMGRAGIFSLQLNKNMTCGEGGLFLTNDEQLYNRAFSAHDMGMVRKDGRLSTPEPYALMWGQGRRMDELRGAVACTQLKKLPRIVKHMQASKRRIQKMLLGTPGLAFRKVHDAAGDSASSGMIILESAGKAQRAVAKMNELGLRGLWRLENYGLHVYFNIPALVNKVPTCAAGHPWNLPENAQSVCEYKKGTCPRSDDLFARTILISIPSRLTLAQEKQAAEAIREAVTTA